jgi:hypothetical protein
MCVQGWGRGMDELKEDKDRKKQKQRSGVGDPTKRVLVRSRPPRARQTRNLARVQLHKSKDVHVHVHSIQQCACSLLPHFVHQVLAQTSHLRALFVSSILPAHTPTLHSATPSPAAPAPVPAQGHRPSLTSHLRSVFSLACSSALPQAPNVIDPALALPRPLFFSTLYKQAQPSWPHMGLDSESESRNNSSYLPRSTRTGRPTPRLCS